MRSRSRNSQAGDVMLLWIVALFVLMSVISLLSAVVVSRALYVGRTINANKAVLDLEDSNVSYRREVSALQMEVTELVTYYFGNGFFQYPTNLSFSGSGPNASHHDSVLRQCISMSVQQEIYHAFDGAYQLKYRALEASGYTDPVEIDKLTRAALTDEVAGLSNFLYAYLISYRCMTDGTNQNHADFALGLPNKFKRVTFGPTDNGAVPLSDRFAAEGIAFAYQLQLTNFGLTKPLGVGESYLRRFRTLYGAPDTTDPELGQLAFTTNMDLSGAALGAALGGINYRQQVQAKLYPADFSATFSAGTYQLIEARGAQKEQVLVWITQAV